MRINESSILKIGNSVRDRLEENSHTESVAKMLNLKSVRTIYSSIRAISSDRLTKNFTLYPEASLIGRKDKENPTGFSSFVHPYGKPIIREHHISGGPTFLGGFDMPERPMGRVVVASYVRHDEKKNGPKTAPKKKYVPGWVEGSGYINAVAAITDPDAIENVLGGIYLTVSIGSEVRDVWESISGTNIAKARRNGEELPPYERGQMYEGKLSYWKLGPIVGQEISFVNQPADDTAGVLDSDIGEAGIKLLLGEKTGKEFNLFDIRTNEKVNSLHEDEFSAVDWSYFTDSGQIETENVWWATIEDPVMTESTGVDVKNELTLENLPKTKEELETLLETQFAGIIDPFILESVLTGENIEKIEISDKDLFTKVSEYIHDLYEDWDTAEANKFLKTYSLLGGSIAAPEDTFEASLEDLFPKEALTVGDKTFELNIEDAKEALKSRGGSVEFSKILCFNLAYYGLITSNSDRDVEAAKNYGIELVEDKLIFKPVTIESTDLSLLEFSSENFETVKNNLEIILESLQLDEANAQQVRDYVNAVGGLLSKENSPLFAFENDVTPVVLPVSHLVEAYQALAGEIKEYLAPLVGLIRKLGVDKKTLSEASHFSVFSVPVLKKFLESVPETIENNSEGDSSSSSTTEPQPSTVVPELIAAQSTASQAKKDSQESWFGKAYYANPATSGKKTKLGK